MEMQLIRKDRLVTTAQYATSIGKRIRQIHKREIEKKNKGLFR